MRWSWSLAGREFPLPSIELYETACVQINHDSSPRASDTNALKGLPGGSSPQITFARARKSGCPVGGTTFAMTLSCWVRNRAAGSPNSGSDRRRMNPTRSAVTRWFQRNNPAVDEREWSRIPWPGRGSPQRSDPGAQRGIGRTPSSHRRDRNVRRVFPDVAHRRDPGRSRLRSELGNAPPVPRPPEIRRVTVAFL